MSAKNVRRGLLFDDQNAPPLTSKEKNSNYLGSENVPISVMQREGKVLPQEVGKLKASERKAQEERQKPQPKETNPQGLTIRIFANGKVCPSQEAIEHFNLEFKNKDQEEQGNGFDVFDSKDWTPTAEFPRMLLFGVKLFKNE